jgi:hypothetical protein
MEDNTPRKRLIAMPIEEGQPFDIQPSPSKRIWMEATHNRYANRCLPLLMANQSGWVLSNPVAFEAIWDGGDTPAAITFRTEGHITYLNTAFGYGVLTFMIPFLFRTEEGYNLLVRGPANRPKDGIGALEGLVETDWAKSSFTMNWKFTRPGRWVRFVKGEPICMILPVRRGELAEFEPTIESMDNYPDTKRVHSEWKESRTAFIENKEERQAAGGWQRHYFRGTTIEGERAEEHESKLTLSPFVRLDGGETPPPAEE